MAERAFWTINPTTNIDLIAVFSVSFMNTFVYMQAKCSIETNDTLRIILWQSTLGQHSLKLGQLEHH